MNILSSCHLKNSENKSNDARREEKIILVIHGGASYPSELRNSPVRDSMVLEEMKQVLLYGQSLLNQGKNAENVVCEVISMLEDCPLFNAGKGAVFNAEGENELDACIMKGKDRSAGAVAGLKRIKNPIRLAKAVMDCTSFVLLHSTGAEEFAKSINMPTVNQDYFFTNESWKELQIAKEKEIKNTKFGTVGAVALDKNGNIAAGTSTGGRTNKKWGRIGDSPIIGASTYADNSFGAVSSTGWGEHFIRNATAHSIIACIEYGKMNLKEACEEILYKKMKNIEGGVIALDTAGKMCCVFNTPVMNRGYISANGKPVVNIYK
jgi:beta-aspartyl-peptidase (threonine type)